MERGNFLLFALQILGCIKCQEAKLALTDHKRHTSGLASGGTWELQPPERFPSIHWPLAELKAQQELDCMASHVGSRRD